MYCYKYPRPALTIDTLVLGYNYNKHELEILLIKRKNPPFKGHYALPGGFVEMEETLEETAARELAEETELLGISMLQLKAFSRPDRDPRGRTITVVFFSLVDSTSSRSHGGDDAESADWFNILELPSLAFDHQEIVDYGIKFAYNNILYKIDENQLAEFSQFNWLIESVGRKKLLEILETYLTNNNIINNNAF